MKLKLGEHLNIWAKHAALNLGAGLQCFYHVVVPPQLDHPAKVVGEILEEPSTVLQEFQYGIGYSKRPRS